MRLKPTQTVQMLNSWKKSGLMQDNDIKIASDFQIRGDIKITNSINNQIVINECSSLKGEISIQGKGNRVLIGRNVTIRGQILVKGNNQTVSIGDNTTFQSVYILCQEGCDVTIGHSCMLSRDIEIRTTDAHSVIDLESRARINTPASVVIGNHVWVGVGALIGKGATIPEDSIVGAYSFVNRAFAQPNVIIAGTPASVVKTGITWNRSRKEKFSREEINSWKGLP